MEEAVRWYCVGTTLKGPFEEALVLPNGEKIGKLRTIQALTTYNNLPEPKAVLMDEDTVIAYIKENTPEIEI